MKDYEVGEKIGAGSFGEIYSATEISTGKKVALKYEPIKSRNKMIEREIKAYLELGSGKGIPAVKNVFQDGDFNIMPMELLGPSLKVLFLKCSKKFTLKTVLMLADQLLDCIEYIHSKGFLHLDLKPGNLLMGVGDNKHQVYIIDFGLCKKYLDDVSGRHIPFREHVNFVGSVKFASFFSHLRIQPSRRNDLVSLGYLFVYFLKGCLPWSEFRRRHYANYRNISNCKKETPPEILCNDLPVEFLTYCEYCKNLSFTQDPNYDYLRGLFRDLFIREGMQNDFVFDWDSFNESKFDDDDSSVASVLERTISGENTLTMSQKSVIEKNNRNFIRKVVIFACLTMIVLQTIDKFQGCRRK